MTKYQDDIGRKMIKALESELLEGFCLQSETTALLLIEGLLLFKFLALSAHPIDSGE